MAGTEQQQFTGSDNLGAQTQATDGITGAGRMELYQDFNSTVGGTTPGDGSLSEKSLGTQDGKGAGEVKFDNIYDQTVSAGGKGGDQGTSTQDDLLGGEGKSNRTESTQGKDTNRQPGEGQDSDPHTWQGEQPVQEPGLGDHKAPQSPEPEGLEAQDGGRGATPTDGEFNGRKDPYTAEALQNSNHDGRPSNENLAGPKEGEKRDGGTPGAPEDDTTPTGEAKGGGKDITGKPDSSIDQVNRDGSSSSEQESEREPHHDDKSGQHEQDWDRQPGDSTPSQTDQQMQQFDPRHLDESERRNWTPNSTPTQT